MGTLGNLFEVLRDHSYQEIEDEASRSVAIALAGNTAEVRDKLHRALSTRLESLWTASPFRLIETHERPEIAAEDEDEGLLLYGLYQGERIPSEKRVWLTELASSEKVSVIIVALDRKSEEGFKNPNEGRGLRNINPLRLVGGREVSGRNSGQAPSADGAAFNGSDATSDDDWQTELSRLVAQSDARIAIGLPEWSRTGPTASQSASDDCLPAGKPGAGPGPARPYLPQHGRQSSDCEDRPLECRTDPFREPDRRDTFRQRLLR